MAGLFKTPLCGFASKPSNFGFDDTVEPIKKNY